MFYVMNKVPMSYLKSIYSKKLTSNMVDLLHSMLYVAGVIRKERR